MKTCRTDGAHAAPPCRRAGEQTASRRPDTAATALALLLLGAAAAPAADWPQWRGPNRDGLSAEAGWLTAWPKGGPKTLWKQKVGDGFSAVSVAGGRAYTLGNVEGIVQTHDVIWCLDAETGKPVWQHELVAKPGMYPGPRSTPTVDGEAVYAMSRYGDVLCLGAKDGAVRWQRNLREEFKVAGEPNNWGLACSPLVLGDTLILDMGKVLALKTADGSPVAALGDEPPGFSSPVCFETGGKRCVTSFNGFGLVVYDLAAQKELGRQAWDAKWKANAATPVAVGDALFVSAGYGRGCGLFRATAQGLAAVYTNAAVASECITPVLYQGHLYAVSGDQGRKGVLKCLDAATGQVKWEHEGFRVGGGLMIADGKIIHLEDTGNLVLAEATPEAYRELARANVLDGNCWTMPVLANGRIYCRNSKGALVCLDVRGSK